MLASTVVITLNSWYIVPYFYSSDTSQERTVSAVGFLFDFQYSASTFCWSWNQIPAINVSESNSGIMVEHLLIWLHVTYKVRTVSSAKINFT
jgi:hypothetical protein